VKVLVVGGGGREHALCWTLAKTATVFCAPGNPGTATLATNLPISVDDHAALLRAVRERRIDLTIVGPEAPLAAGLVDRLEARGCRAFGPSAAAAQIEASKAFAKRAMAAAGVPTAAARSFTAEGAALDYIRSHEEPLVLKASGLAAGKGVFVCQTRSEAADAARRMLRGAFGDAGREILIEEHLTGEELSILGVTDGEHVMLLPTSQDHKRLDEGDTGPNTGGMGAYAPVSLATQAFLCRLERDVFHPILRYLADRGAPYRGVLYAGIITDVSASIRVLEFNCRFGDPEAQVVLPISGIELAEHAWSIAARERWPGAGQAVPAVGAAVTTVLAAPGYPGAPVKGAEIRLPAALPRDTLLFHAGTELDGTGCLRTAGGRVLCATGLGEDVPQAGVRSRALAEAVAFEGKVFRRDIAWREIARAGAS
jgi:phosphoribosylamine--glycine ligase